MSAPAPGFWRAAIRTGTTAAVVAAAGAAVPLGSTIDPDVPLALRMARTLFVRDLNLQAGDDEIAGYYEGLIAGRPRDLLGNAHESEHYRFRNDFLYYEAKPNLASTDPEDALVTNSFGMADQEYALEPQPGTWRIAVIGDSVTRGQGAPFGASFEALLERRLNEAHRTPDVERFELLNFSTTGYRLTQMVEVAHEKVPPFRPDVYVLALTRLSVSSRWGDHLIQLVYDGIDLEYDYLKELAARAELSPNEHAGALRAKLAPLRLPAIRWAVSEIRDRAAADGATLLVLLVPTATPPERLEPAFAGVPDLLEELGIPYVNLIGTFGGVPDLSPFRVSAGNVHPNGPGHQRIFEVLYGAVQGGDAAAALLLGPAGGAPGRTEAR